MEQRTWAWAWTGSCGSSSGRETGHPGERRTAALHSADAGEPNKTLSRSLKMTGMVQSEEAYGWSSSAKMTQTA